MIAHVLFDKAVCIVATNHWVRKIKILNNGLKLSLVLLSDLATEDHGNLVGLADRTVSVQQSLAELIQCGPPAKDQVVTIFYLGEEEPMLTAATFAFAFSEEWSQTGQPFLSTAEQIIGGQGICQLLQLLRMTAFQKCIGTLLEINAFAAHPVSQPMVLIEADPC